MLPYISPVSSVLDTNYIPSDEEIVEIRRHMDEVAPEVTELEAKIAKIVLELQVLQDQHSKCEKYLSRHRSLLSPIRRIPVDILQVIFRHCLPTKHNALMLAAQAPILLTHVCQYWRKLAIGTPELWCSIHISIPHYPPVSSVLRNPVRQKLVLPRSNSSFLDHGLNGEAARIFEDTFVAWRTTLWQRKRMMVDWLQRASGMGLSINLTFASWDRDQLHSERESQEMRDIIDVVKGCSRQWKKLEISAPFQVVRELVTMPATEAPNIEALGIYTYLTDPRRPSTEERLLFPGSIGVEGTIIAATTLRSVNLVGIYDNLGNIPVRWENLTSFEFHGYLGSDSGGPIHTPTTLTPNQALALLGFCPNLVECGLAIVSASRETPRVFHPRVVGLVHLESLWVCEQDNQPLNDFFQCLETPRLAYIKFMTSITPPDTGPTALNDGLWTQLFQLTQNGLVTVNHPAPPRLPPSLPILLRSCGRGITTLEFDYHFQTPDSLRECLTLVPNVENLRLTVMNWEDINGWHGAVPFHQASRRSASSPSAALLDDKAFRTLLIHPGDGNAPLCPRMTSFSIRLPWCEFSEQTLLDFVRTRRSTNPDRAVVPLRRLEVAFAEESESARRQRWRMSARDKGWMTKGEWVALRELEGDPRVDLEGFTAKVTWPLDPLLKDLILAASANGNLGEMGWKRRVKGPLSPAWGLEKGGYDFESILAAIEGFF